MTTEFAVRRLVVATDAAVTSEATFARAAGLAARLGASLAGLLIEDERLLRAAALPLSGYVSGLPGAASFDARSLESELRALTARTRAALAAAARQAGVAWTLDVLRGDPAAQIAQATGPGDLVVVGPEADAPGRALRAGAALRVAAERTARSVLLTRQGSEIHRPLVVTEAGSPLNARVISAAARLAADRLAEIDVLSIGAAAADQALVGLLAEHGIRARLRRVDVPTARRLAETARLLGSDLMVLAADLSLAGEAPRALLDCAECEILVIR